MFEITRHKYFTKSKVSRKGLVLGFYETDKKGEVELTPTAEKFQKDSQQNLTYLLDV